MSIRWNLQVNEEIPRLRRCGRKGEGEVSTASRPRTLDHSSASMSSSLDPNIAPRTLHLNRSYIRQGNRSSQRRWSAIVPQS